MLCVWLFALSVVVVVAQNSPADPVCQLEWGMFVTDEPWNEHMNGMRTIDTAVNRHSQIVHWYTNWADGSGNFQYNVKHYLEVIRNYTSNGVTGSTPMITWQPWGPSFTNSPAEYPLQRIANGDYDDYIDTWVDGLKALPYTVYLRTMHEMDGTWYPWGQGVNGNTPTQFINAYRHVHDRFSAKGVTNVKHVWCPTNSNTANLDQTTLYPGDDYVDWLCLDAYNTAGAGWVPFNRTITDWVSPLHVYDRLTALNNKPMMLAEWGSPEPNSQAPAGVSKGAWMEDAARVIVTQFPRIKALVYFSSGIFQLNSSTNALEGTRRGFGGCDSAGNSAGSSTGSSAGSGTTGGIIATTTAVSDAPTEDVSAALPSTAPLLWMALMLGFKVLLLN